MLGHDSEGFIQVWEWHKLYTGCGLFPSRNWMIFSTFIVIFSLSGEVLVLILDVRGFWGPTWAMCSTVLAFSLSIHLKIDTKVDLGNVSFFHNNYWFVFFSLYLLISGKLWKMYKCYTLERIGLNSVPHELGPLHVSYFLSLHSVWSKIKALNVIKSDLTGIKF